MDGPVRGCSKPSPHFTATIENRVAGNYEVSVSVLIRAARWWRNRRCHYMNIWHNRYALVQMIVIKTNNYVVSDRKHLLFILCRLTRSLRCRRIAKHGKTAVFLKQIQQTRRHSIRLNGVNTGIPLLQYIQTFFIGCTERRIDPARGTTVQH